MYILPISGEENPLANLSCAPVVAGIPVEPLTVNNPETLAAPVTWNFSPVSLVVPTRRLPPFVKRILSVLLLTNTRGSFVIEPIVVNPFPVIILPLLVVEY